MAQVGSLSSSLSFGAIPNLFTGSNLSQGLGTLPATGRVDHTLLSDDLADEPSHRDGVSNIIDGLKGHETHHAKKSSPPDYKNPTQFAKGLLKKLGAPDSKANVKSLVDWQHMEGGNWKNDAHYNPLNTTQSEPGATDMNSDGVKSYKNWTQGLDATAKTLQSPDYDDIVKRLKTGQGLGSGYIQGLATWSGGAYSSIG